MKRGFWTMMAGSALFALALPLLSGCGPGNDIGAEADTPWRPGAATRRNIAALAEDPADLHRPRREAPRDAVRRDAVIGHYTQRRADAPASETLASEAKAKP